MNLAHKNVNSVIFSELLKTSTFIYSNSHTELYIKNVTLAFKIVYSIELNYYCT